MAALMGLTQAVVRSLTDVTELPARSWDFPVLRWVENPFGNRSNRRSRRVTSPTKSWKADSSTAILSVGGLLLISHGRAR